MNLPVRWPDCRHGSGDALIVQDGGETFARCADCAKRFVRRGIQTRSGVQFRWSRVSTKRWRAIEARADELRAVPAGVPP